MDIIKSVTIGVVQGITEWLPVSSNAHMEIVPRLLNWPDTGARGGAIIQLGTTVAVIIYFWKDLLGMATAFFKSLQPGGDKTTLEARLGWAVVLGTIPVVVAGLLLKKYIEREFRSLWVIAFALIVMGIVLLVSEIVAKHKRSIETVQQNDGWIVGLAQCLALVPGVSRSGATITGALFMGFTREAAARFSFLLSVPAVALAGLYELYDAIKHKGEPVAPNTMDWSTGDLIVATIVAGLVGYATIGLLLRFLRTNSTIAFVVYRVVLGGLLLYLLATGKLMAQ